MLDQDLALIYGVELRVLKQSVKRNAERFPEDFMWSLNEIELADIRSQSVIESLEIESESSLMQNIRSQSVIEYSQRRTLGRKGSRYAPYAFTEHGVAMLSSVLNSSTAIQINIQIIRAFTELRNRQTDNFELAPKLESLESRLNHRIDQLEARLQKDTASATALRPIDDPVCTIQNTVAQYFGLTVSKLKSSSRMQRVSLARHLSVFFMRTKLGMSFSEIGRQTGGRDHSTILHAYRKIQSSLQDNASVATAVSAIQDRLAPLSA